MSGCWGVHLVAAFMVSGYTGVTKPLYRGRQDKWLAQSKPHGVWRYGFDTPEEGAEWLANQLKLKDVGALARSSTGGPSPQLAVSGYQGVVRHLRPAGKPYFEARARGVTVSSHATYVEAAMAVAKKRRVSVESLKKKQPQGCAVYCAMRLAHLPCFINSFVVAGVCIFCGPFMK